MGAGDADRTIVHVHLSFPLPPSVLTQTAGIIQGYAKLADGGVYIDGWVFEPAMGPAAVPASLVVTPSPLDESVYQGPYTFGLDPDVLCLESSCETDHPGNMEIMFHLDMAKVSRSLVPWPVFGDGELRLELDTYIYCPLSI